ncbi:MAG: phosphoadenosine phosphosulfate reductase [Halanaerobium sp. MSAO_Bac5]|nr:MAG: phosphoadenosine phosphosulfate reductase [Halanaerobium sp. MSAO_Bac5]
MEVFWCDECNSPVVLPKYKSNFKYEEYLDVEDEVLNYIKEKDYNTKQKLYNNYSKLKKDINKAIDNKNEENIHKDLNNNINQKNKELKMIYKLSKKYLYEKMYNGNVESQKKLKRLNVNYYERISSNDKIDDYFCPSCSSQVRRIAKDLRPVFTFEKILLEEAINIELMDSSVWADNTRYIIDGEVADFSKRDLYDAEDILIGKRKKIMNRINNSKRKDEFNNFVKINREHYNMIENKARNFVNNTSEIFSDSMHIVSFSGGKDSTVTSDLVIRALKTHKIMHIFGDTSLEFPTTYEYIEKLKRQTNSPPFMVAKDYQAIGENKDKKFFDLSKEFGPPSRVVSWCCTIFKTGPIGNLFRNIAEDSEIFTYYGIRRNESSNRSNYDKISRSPKIIKQMVGSPIIDWKDIDIWLYLLTRNIDFNEAYRYGFTRVGCLYCPNNSKWSEFLLKIFFPDYSNKWNNFLVQFAKDIGKPDPEVYIEQGNWKARQGGSGVDSQNKSNTVIESKPCGLSEDAISYELTKAISDELYELFKPFGKLDFNSGNTLLNEVYIRDKKQENIFLLQGKIGQRNLKINIIKTKNSFLLKKRIECQLRKFQSCIDCGACANVCPNNAINTREGYSIDEEKCIHCLKCVAAFHKGCLVAKTTMDY